MKHFLTEWLADDEPKKMIKWESDRLFIWSKFYIKYQPANDFYLLENSVKYVFQFTVHVKVNHEKFLRIVALQIFISAQLIHFMVKVFVKILSVSKNLVIKIRTKNHTFNHRFYTHSNFFKT